MIYRVASTSDVFDQLVVVRIAARIHRSSGDSLERRRIEDAVNQPGTLKRTVHIVLRAQEAGVDFTMSDIA